MAACPRMGARRPTIRELGSMPTAAAAAKITMSTPHQPRPSPSAWFLDEDQADADAAAASSGHHFLDECHTCGRHLPRNRDVYMYKGDTPFCSEECRGEQVRIDEHQERASRRRRAAKAFAAEAAASEGKPSASAEIMSQTATVAVGAV